MKKFLLGNKIGMTSLWDENNNRVPVTVLEVGPCHVVQKKRLEKDAYNAIQIGYKTYRKEKNMTKADKGHQKTVYQKTQCYFTHLKEIRDFNENLNEGDKIDCSIFKVGEKVVVSSISKGKGFQGVVKRYGFRGGRKTHGSHFHRAPGAISAGTYPGRVLKGKKMPGRMGNKRAATKNLEIIKILIEENLVFIKGSVPGPKKALVGMYIK